MARTARKESSKPGSKSQNGSTKSKLQAESDNEFRRLRSRSKCTARRKVQAMAVARMTEGCPSARALNSKSQAAVKAMARVAGNRVHRKSVKRNAAITATCWPETTRT